MRSLFRGLCLGGSLGMVVLLSGQGVGGVPADWQGVWSGDLPGYGNVALKISPSGPDEALRVELWWLFADVKTASSSDAAKPVAPRLTNGSLLIDRFDHTEYFSNYRTVPGLAFQMRSSDEMKLAPYGIFDQGVSPLWAELVLRRDQTGQVWRDRHALAGKLTDWKVRGKNGSINPLPSSWSAEVIMPTALLFSYNSAIFTGCLTESKLPPDFVRTVCVMAQEVPGSEFQTSTFRALAGNPRTTQEALGTIWTHRDDLRSWYLVASHPQAKAEWHDGLVDRVMSGDDQLKMLAAVIETGPDELYPRLIADGRARRFDLAGNFHLPPFVYETLARNHAGEVGRILAKNAAVPPGILDLLAETKDRERKFVLLANPSLREETGIRLARELSDSATFGEYGKLALSQWTPVDVLVKCTKIPDPMTRILMARSPYLDQSILQLLANDKVRDVARVAREKMQARFPESYTTVQPTWKALDTLATTMDETQQCRLAIEENDIETIRMLLGYLRESMGVETCLKANAEVVIKEYRPEIMDLFLSCGLKNDEFTLAELEGHSARNPQWLAYFKAHGVRDGKMRGQVLGASIADDGVENLRALIAAGFDVNLRDFWFLTALHRAVLKRNQAAVELILAAGGDPKLKDSRGMTPLEWAAKTLFLPAILRLDDAGRYSGLVDEVSRDFLKQGDARLLGKWSSVGTYPSVVIDLFSDGIGRLETAGQEEEYFAWRVTENNQLETRFPTSMGAKSSTPVISLSYKAKSDALSVKRAEAEYAFELRRHRDAK